MDGSPTALTYELPRVASSSPGPEPPQRVPSRQGRFGPYRQQGDICVNQPAVRLHSRCMSQLARHLLWRKKHLRSLPAIHIPGVFNQAANELSRAALPGEWRLYLQAVQLIGVSSEWLRYTCFHLQKPAHYQWFPTPYPRHARHGCTGTQLAPGPAQTGSSYYRFTTSTIHKTDLCAEVEPVLRMVFLSPLGTPEMFDQSHAVLPAPYFGA